MTSSNPTTTNAAGFDYRKGSTIDKGIDDAHVPDVTRAMKDAAHIALMTPMGDPWDPMCIWGAPVIFWGLPSTAKSDKVKQACIECMMPYAPIYPGRHQPEDFSGVLVPTPDGVRMECILQAVRWLNPQKRGCIFVDEATGATRATEGAMLGFYQDRVVGDVPLSPGIRILLAANPPKWSVTGYSLTPPTASRLCHLQVKCPPYKEWIDFMISENATPKFDAAKTEDVVRQRWGSAYGHAKAVMTGYQDFRTGFTLHMEPDVRDPQSSYCWPQPRGWRTAARIRATAECLGYPNNLAELMMEGCVGEGACQDMVAWERTADLPRPEDIMRKGYKPDPHRLDVAFAVLTSLTEYVISIPDRQHGIECAIRAWEVLGEFTRANMGDMVVSSASTLATKNYGRGSGDDRIVKVADPVLRFIGRNELTNHFQA